MKGLVGGIVGLFTRNWGLKLLALALALVIYHSIKEAAGSRQRNNDRPILES